MDQNIIDELKKVPGIGAALAKRLVKAGARSVDDLSKKKYWAMLAEEARLSIKYGLRAERIIPWDFMKSLVGKLPRGFVAVGSFRRKRPLLKDLDIITLRKKAEAIRAIERKASPPKKDSEFAPEPPFDLMEKYSSGPKKHSFIILFKDRYIRVDLFFIEDEAEWPFALLHYTGSMQFNVRVRAQAKRRGYKLNQFGIFDKQSGKRLDLRGKLGVEKLTERHILEFVGVTYKRPEERNE